MRSPKLALQGHNVVHHGIGLKLLVHLSVDRDLDARLCRGDLSVDKSSEFLYLVLSSLDLFS